MVIATYRKLRPMIKCPGGKSYLARRIVAALPPHDRYIEPCAGGISVLLNKGPCAFELAADIDPDIINMYNVLKSSPDLLLASLRRLLYDESVFVWYRDVPGTRTALEGAVSYIVRNRFSRGGMGRDFAWSERLRGGQPGDVNGWQTAVEQIPAIADRIRDVTFCVQDLRATIAQFDAPGTLFYCDPPYPHSVRVSKSIYGWREMSDDQHREFLGLIARARGMYAISSYRSAMYDDALRGWRRLEFEIANHAGQTKVKSRRVECLYLSPNCEG